MEVTISSQPFMSAKNCGKDPILFTSSVAGARPRKPEYLMYACTGSTGSASGDAAIPPVISRATASPLTRPIVPPDKTLSQTHASCLADINGDGLPDYVTGKRYWAHVGKDPGADEPSLVVWYELSRAGGRPQWTRHTIDDDSGVGTQFEVVDVNGDGLLDVVTSNKKGVFYFQQVRE